VRILLWHVHGSWTTAFVQGGHEYVVPVTPDRGADGLGRARTWTWPTNVVELPPQDLPDLDPARAVTDVVDAAQRLVARWPMVREIVLECTNMPPYAKAVARATRRPVHHILSVLHERWRALDPLT